MELGKLNIIKEELNKTGESKVIKNYKLACEFFEEEIKTGKC